MAEADRGIVGYASFVPGYNTDIAARELWMLDLFVMARWRGRGVGLALMAAVAREAVRRRLNCIEWGVRGDNTGARRFYRRLGATIGDLRIAALIGPALTAVAARRCSTSSSTPPPSPGTTCCRSPRRRSLVT